MADPQYLTAAEARASAGAGKYLANAAILDADINTAAQWVSAYADGYLSVVRTLPLVSWGGDLKLALAGMVAYRVASGRGFDAGSVGSTARDLWNDGVRWLEQVRDGKINPSGMVGTSSDEGATAEVFADELQGW